MVSSSNFIFSKSNAKIILVTLMKLLFAKVTTSKVPLADFYQWNPFPKDCLWIPGSVRGLNKRQRDD